MIGAAEYKERLERLLVRGGGGDWPRDPRDQHILMKSIIWMFEKGRQYSETEVNQQLEKWIEAVAPQSAVDFVKLRRYLVDAGYFHRDRAGYRYQVDVTKATERFEPEVERVNPITLVADARRRVEERKKAYLKGKRA